MIGVSVVLPTKNRPSFLRRALSSVADQSGCKIEVLIACENPDPADSGQALKDSAVPGKVIFTGGVGPAKSRNLAADEAKFDWLAFLDDDDVWPKGHLSRGIKIGSQIKNCSLFYGNAICEQTNQSVLSGRVPIRGQGLSALLLDNVIATSTAMMPAQLFFKLGGFETEFEPAEDYRLWLKAAAAGPLAFDPSFHATVSFCSERLSANEARSFLATARVIEAFLAQNYLSSGSVVGLTKRLADLYHAAALDLYQNGHFSEARKILWRSVKIQPTRFLALRHLV